jgi:peptidoglycan-N-acetylglucosamine deacetylase
MVDRSANILRRALGRFSRGVWLPVIRRTGDASAVALTYDDGPSEHTTPALLAVLRAFDAKATFFLTGVRVAAAPELVRQICTEGHAVYAHGWEHVRYDRETPERLLADLDRTEAELRRVRPTPRPYLVRLPYAAGLAEPWVHEALHRWDPRTQFAHWADSFFDWTLADGGETDEDLRAACEGAVRKTLRRTKPAGAVFLLHEDPFDVTAARSPLVAPILTRLLLQQIRLDALRTETLSAYQQIPRYRAYIRG